MKIEFFITDKNKTPAHSIEKEIFSRQEFDSFMHELQKENYILKWRKI